MIKQQVFDSYRQNQIYIQFIRINLFQGYSTILFQIHAGQNVKAGFLF